MAKRGREIPRQRQRAQPDSSRRLPKASGRIWLSSRDAGSDPPPHFTFLAHKKYTPPPWTLPGQRTTPTHIDKKNCFRAQSQKSKNCPTWLGRMPSQIHSEEGEGCQPKSKYTNIRWHRGDQVNSDFHKSQVKRRRTYRQEKVLQVLVT